MSVPFRFDTVLRVREAERDRCQQGLALEQQREAVLAAERDRLSAERSAVLDELRQSQQGEGLSADQEMARRQYADHLATEIARAVTALNEATSSVAQRRNELLEVDTAVKALENLAGRHTADQTRIEQANSEREREETWRGGRVA